MSQFVGLDCAIVFSLIIPNLLASDVFLPNCKTLGILENADWFSYAFVNCVQLIWSGLVFNPEVNDEDTVALRNMAQKLHSDQRVNVSFLTIGDGTYLAFKK
jgi:O-methyltransferase